MAMTSFHVASSDLLSLFVKSLSLLMLGAYCGLFGYSFCIVPLKGPFNTRMIEFFFMAEGIALQGEIVPKKLLLNE